MSENGWPPDTDAAPFVSISLDDCVQVTIPGTTETLWFQKGAPAIILPAFMADLNAYIEPSFNSAGYTDEGSWTNGNSVGTSNHLGATAFDYNWTDHPMGPAPEDPAAGWGGSSLIAGPQWPAIRALIDWYEGTVFWGGDWTSPQDSMHFQMGYDTFDPNGPQVGNPGTAAVQDFIARKIRPDGFSTYQRGGTDTPDDTATGAAVLAAATGLDLSAAQTILPAFTAGLIAADCTTVPRIAMAAAQWGWESANFSTTVEFGGGAGQPYFPYCGRTWIQITWESNYLAFGQWCVEQGLISAPNQFVNDPASLGDVQWAGIGAAWYWTQERPINDLIDAGDNASWNGYIGAMSAVTAAINGGQNGIDGRQALYDLAIAQGDALLTLINQQEPDMSFTPADRDLLNQISGIFRPSLSPFRHVGEGNVNTCAGFAWSTDGLVHAGFVSQFAVDYGHVDSILLLWEVAQNTDPARATDAALATRVLAKVSNADVAAASGALAAWLAAEQAATPPPTA